MHKFSKHISTILHPILLPTIATLIFFIVVPYGFPLRQIYLVSGFVFLGSYIFPLLLLILFKNLKIISSFEIHNLKERKIPVISFLIISLLIGKTLFSLPQLNILSILFFGCFLALSIIYLLLFLNFKTSLHLTGISGFTAFMVVLSLYYNLNLTYLIALLLFLNGLLATARLFLKAHSPIELLIGFIIGVGSISLTSYLLL
jgi:membrane-associated phospholipid phosphatase